MWLCSPSVQPTKGTSSGGSLHLLYSPAHLRCAVSPRRSKASARSDFRCKGGVGCRAAASHVNSEECGDFVLAHVVEIVRYFDFTLEEPQPLLLRGGHPRRRPSPRAFRPWR